MEHIRRPKSANIVDSCPEFSWVLPIEAFPQKGYRNYNFTWYIFEWYSVKLSCGNHESFACVRQKFHQT
jgi:hypothetical protein